MWESVRSRETCGRGIVLWKGASSNRHHAKGHHARGHHAKRHHTKRHRAKRHHAKGHHAKRHHAKRHHIKRRNAKRHHAKRHHAKRHYPRSLRDDNGSTIPVSDRFAKLVQYLPIFLIFFDIHLLMSILLPHTQNSFCDVISQGRVKAKIKGKMRWKRSGLWATMQSSIYINRAHIL